MRHVLLFARWVTVGLLAGFCLVAIAFRYSLSTHRPAEMAPRKFGETQLVRVNVTPDSSAAVEIEVRGPFEIRDAAHPERVLDSGEALESATLRTTSEGWSHGKRHWTAKEIELQPRGSALIRLGSHEYSGAVRFIHALDDRWQAINHLPLEEYLASVVDSEMPLEFGLEARKAQAVVARTYVVHRCLAEARQTRVFDVWGDTRSQKYQGVRYRKGDGRWLAGTSPSSRQAVRETQGIVCRYEGEVFCTYYTAACGGRTYHGRELFPDAAEPVRSVACPGCVDAPLFRWDRRVDRRTVESRILSLASSRKSGLKSISQIRRKPRPVGSLPSYILADGRREITLNGWEFRRILGSDLLPSPEFEVTWNDQSCLVHGAGHGHGVGLCQWGARGLARKGMSYRDILAHYYPDVEIGP